MQTKPRQQMDMLHGPLLSKIFFFALPLALSSILQQLFNSADTAVVGRFAGAQALAAVGANGEVVGLFIEIFVGLSVGANVLVARHLGRGEKERIPSSVHTIILLAVIVGSAIALIGQFVAGPLLTLIRTPDEIMDQAVTYLRLYLLGSPFIALYNFGAAILQAKGDSRRPLIALTLSGIVNVLLNLLFVVGFHMSAAGVALATIISNLISASLILRMLYKEEHPFQLKFGQLALDRKSVGKILAIGIPAGIQGSVFCLSNIFIQSQINALGANAIAGNAAALNLELFSYYTVTAFAHAATTFISQNYAAGKLERCRRIFWLSIGLGAAMSGLVSVPLTVFRYTVIRLYTVEEAVIAIAVIRIMHVLILEPFCILFEAPAGALRGMGHSIIPAIETILGTVVFRLIWIVLVVSREKTYESITRVYLYSWILTALMLLISYAIILKRETHSGREALQS